MSKITINSEVTIAPKGEDQYVIKNALKIGTKSYDIDISCEGLTAGKLGETVLKVQQLWKGIAETALKGTPSDDWTLTCSYVHSKSLEFSDNQGNKRDLAALEFKSQKLLSSKQKTISVAGAVSYVYGQLMSPKPAEHTSSSSSGIPTQKTPPLSRRTSLNSVSEKKLPQDPETTQKINDLSSSLQKAQQQIQDLNFHLDNLKRVSKNLAQENNDLRNNENALVDGFEKYGKNLLADTEELTKGYRSELSQSKQQVKVLVDQHQNLLDDLTASKQESLAREADLNGLLATEKKYNTELKRDIETNKKDLSSLQSKLNETNSKITSLEKSKNDLFENNETYSKKLLEALANSKTLTTLVDNLSTENTKNKKDNFRLEQRTSHLENTCTSLQESNKNLASKGSTISQENDQLLKDNTHLIKDNDALVKKAASLDVELKKLSSAQPKNEQLNLDLEDTKRKLSSSEKELASLNQLMSKSMEKIQEILNSQTPLQAEVARLQDDRKNHEATIVQLKTDINKFQIEKIAEAKEFDLFISNMGKAIEERDSSAQTDLNIETPIDLDQIVADAKAKVARAFEPLFTQTSSSQAAILSNDMKMTEVEEPSSVSSTFGAPTPGNESLSTDIRNRFNKVTEEEQLTVTPSPKKLSDLDKASFAEKFNFFQGMNY